MYEAFIKTDKSILEYAQFSEKEWIIDATWTKIEERCAAKIGKDAARTRGAKQAATIKHRQLCREFSRMCRRDKRAWAESMTDEAESAVANGDLRMLYEKSKILTNGHTTSCVPMRNRNEKLITDVSKQQQLWSSTFRADS